MSEQVCYNAGMETQERYKTLANGAIYDMEKKRITANPGGGKYAITSETASDFHAKRQEKKRRAIEAGAQAAVMDKMPDAFTGDDGDWIEAVAQQVAYKALDKLDPKQVDAARFLFTEAGLSEAKQAQTQAHDSATEVLRQVASIAASLAHAFDNSNYRNRTGEVIDAQTTDTTGRWQAGEAGEGETTGDGVG